MAAAYMANPSHASVPRGRWPVRSSGGFAYRRRVSRQSDGHRQLRPQLPPLPVGCARHRHRSGPNRVAATAGAGGYRQLGFTVAGFGTPEDPRLEARASLKQSCPGRRAAGRAGSCGTHRQPHGHLRRHQPDGDGRVHVARPDGPQRRLCYPGQTRFFAIQHRALLKLAHAEGLSGESALPAQSPSRDLWPGPKSCAARPACKNWP